MEKQSLKRRESSVLTEKVAQWLINCCLFKGLLGERGLGLGTETRYQYGTGTYGTGMY